VQAQQAVLLQSVGAPNAAADAGSPSSFFLFHGFRSLMGGNTDAALHRLGRCRDLLLQELRAAEEAAAADGPGDALGERSDGPHAAVSALACRLGAVCGSLGDCWRQRGDLAAAEAALQQSAAHLRRFAAADPEAAHALSVTLGKLGDLQFYRVEESHAGGSGGGGAHAAAAPPHAANGAAAAAEAVGRGRSPEERVAAAALPWYEEALDHRRALCGPLSHGRAGPPATLDLVAALAKVADAHEALGGAAAAQRCWRQAAAELHELKLQLHGGAGAPHGGAAFASKMRALEDLLVLRGHMQA